MKLLSTRVNCRGCQSGETVQFQSPRLFGSRYVPFTCKKCGSKCVAEIKREWLKNKINVRIKMITHTQTLLNILKKRRSHAKNHSQG